MKKSIIILLAILFVAIFALGGCTKANDPSIETPAADTSSISEDDALAVALEDAGIQETAAENLTITKGEFEGKEAYVIAFVWSGFDYEYTIDANTSEILQTVFDGDVL